MEIRLPEKVDTIIKRIQSAGFEAYAVGGCVRDSLLGREPGDWDITTSALPHQVKGLFEKTFDTGIEHGTVTVLLGREGFEVTTYRIDGEYEDSRHPKDVIFTGNLAEDLKRRDFTINAMAYNEGTGVVDIFGGMDDLAKGTIRCVGDAKERFSEDALRILRAVRFAAQLGFEIEEETKLGIRQMAGDLANISAERIQTELIKMVISPHPEQILAAWELGITKVILPEFDAMMETKQETPHHKYNVGIHTVKAMEAVAPDKVLRLTMLLHDCAKPQMKTIDENGVAHFKGHDVKGEETAKTILKRLKFDNDTMRKVCRLVRWHDYRMPAAPKAVRKAVYKIGEDIFAEYLAVRKADLEAQADYQKEEKEANLKGAEACYREILEKKQCVSLKTLAVSGSDLIAAGMSPGKEIGIMLQKLLDYVIEHPEENEKDTLLTLVNKL